MSRPPASTIHMRRDLETCGPAVTPDDVRDFRAICWDGHCLDLTRLDDFVRHKQAQDASRDRAEYLDEMSLGGVPYEPGSAV